MYDDTGGYITSRNQPNYYATPDVAKRLNKIFGVR